MQQFNIYHRKDGRWEGRISRGKREDGKRRFQYVFGKSRKQVRDKMIQIKKSEATESCTLSVETLCMEWLESAKHRIKSSAASNYEMKIDKHIIPYIGVKTISSVSADDINSFISRKQNDGLSNRYISDIIILMKSLFKYAVKKYHITNPMENIVMPRRSKPEIRLLDKDEQAKLKNFISANQNLTTIGIALTMTTGIRIGELCALQWKDIDLEKRILTVRKTIQRIQIKDCAQKTKVVISDPKSESSKRIIPLTYGMVQLLSKFQGNADEYLLSATEKPIEPRTIQYRFAKILKNVNLPSVHFHALRHMFASDCIKLGFDVKALSELLGHSNVETTLNRYVHSSFEQKREYMERLQYNF